MNIAFRNKSLQKVSAVKVSTKERKVKFLSCGHVCFKQKCIFNCMKIFLCRNAKKVFIQLK